MRHGGALSRGEERGDAEAVRPTDQRPSAQVMLETLAWLGNRYGGVDAYLESIGVTLDQRAQLRATLVKLVVSSSAL